MAQKRNESFDDFLSDRLEPSPDPSHSMSTMATNGIQHACALGRILSHCQCHMGRRSISRPQAPNNDDERDFECNEDSSSADQSSIDTWEMRFWTVYKLQRVRQDCRPADGLNSCVFVCMQRYFGGDWRHLAAVYWNYQTCSPDFCLASSESCCLSCENVERAHNVRPSCSCSCSIWRWCEYSVVHFTWFMRECKHYYNIRINNLPECHKW